MAEAELMQKWIQIYRPASLTPLNLPLTRNLSRNKKDSSKLVNVAWTIEAFNWIMILWTHTHTRTHTYAFFGIPSWRDGMILIFSKN